MIARSVMVQQKMEFSAVENKVDNFGEHSNLGD